MSALLLLNGSYCESRPTASGDNGSCVGGQRRREAKTGALLDAALMGPHRAPHVRVSTRSRQRWINARAMICSRIHGGASSVTLGMSLGGYALYVELGYPKHAPTSGAVGLLLRPANSCRHPTSFRGRPRAAIDIVGYVWGYRAWDSSKL
jgi:hypothetical protein